MDVDDHAQGTVEAVARFPFGVSAQSGAAHLDHSVHAGPQPFGVAKQAANLLPNLLLLLLGS
jgi:hypothetical protein